MKQEVIDELMNKIDRKCKLPKHWEEFIEKNAKMLQKTMKIVCS